MRISDLIIWKQILFNKLLKVLMVDMNTSDNIILGGFISGGLTAIYYAFT